MAGGGTDTSSDWHWVIGAAIALVLAGYLFGFGPLGGLQPDDDKPERVTSVAPASPSLRTPIITTPTTTRSRYVPNYSPSYPYTPGVPGDYGYTNCDGSVSNRYHARDADGDGVSCE